MRYRLIALALVFLVVAAIPALGAAYVKYDGVDGESKDADHKGWSDILSFNQAIHKPGGGATGQSRRRGAVVFDDIVITKELDKAGIKLAESVAKGTVYPKVDIEVTSSYSDAGRVTYYAYELKNVLVTSYGISGGADDRPTEEIAMNFEEIKVTYTEFDEAGNPVGNVEYSWKADKGK